MVSKMTMPDGTVRIVGDIPPFRFGTTPLWAYAAGGADMPATFNDGKPARVGDMLISTNGFGLGESYTITKVRPSGNVDVIYTGLPRFQMLWDTGWAEIGTSGKPPFQNGWVNYGLGHATAAYRLINGIVHLRGLVKGGSVGATIPMFTLPAGYRPALIQTFTGLNNAAPTGAASAGTAHTHNVGGIGTRFDINPDGTLCPVIGLNGYFGLSCSFVADQ